MKDIEITLYVLVYEIVVWFTIPISGEKGFIF